MMSRSGSIFRFAVSALCVLLLIGACKRADTAAPDGTSSAEHGQSRKDLLVFPDELRAEDESVNAFLTEAMRTCSAGNYEDFRLIWSARREPLSRAEYEKGWQAVQEIRIRALERVMLSPDPGEGESEDQLAYAVLADVELDPTHRAAKSEPHREVVLLLVREFEDWRLAQAPRRVRSWILEKVTDGPRPAGELTNRADGSSED